MYGYEKHDNLSDWISLRWWSKENFRTVVCTIINPRRLYV